jgi:hypothetical protein
MVDDYSLPVKLISYGPIAVATIVLLNLDDLFEQTFITKRLLAFMAAIMIRALR